MENCKSNELKQGDKISLTNGFNAIFNKMKEDKIIASVGGKLYSFDKNLFDKKIH